MFKTTILYQLTALSLLLLAARAKYNLVPQLNQYCPKVADINGFADQQKHPFDVQKVNILDTEALITSEGVEAKGEGGFGKVFFGDYYTSVSEKRPEAIKLVLVPEDMNRDEQDEQNMLWKEVMSHQKLNQMDPERDYFTGFYFCAEITSDVAVMNKSSAVKNKEYINVPRTAAFLYYTEKMTIDLYKYMQKVQFSQMRMFSISERMKLGLHYIKAINTIKATMEHCDIKPENLMIKKISKEEADQLMARGVDVSRLGTDYYIGKMIDFGFVQMKTGNGKVECPGGTRGYLPQEYFENKPSNGSDILALGMNLIDMELTAHGIGLASDLLAQSQDMRLKGLGKFTKDAWNRAKGIPSMRYLFSIIDKEEYKPEIRAAALEALPSLNETLAKIETDQKKVSNFGIAGMNLFLYEFMFKKGLEYLPNHEKFNSYNKKDLESTQLAIQNLNKSAADYESKKLKLELAAKIAEQKIGLAKSYYNLILGMINPIGSRISSEDLISHIEGMLQSYEATVESLKSEYDGQADLISQMAQVNISPREYSQVMITDAQRNGVQSGENKLQVGQSQMFLV